MSVSTAVMGPRSTSARCGRGEAANWARKEWKIVAHLVKIRVRVRVRVRVRIRVRLGFELGPGQLQGAPLAEAA